MAVPGHFASARKAVVLDERLRRSRQDASLPPTAEQRGEYRVSGTGVAIECAFRRARTRKGRLLATIAAIAVGIAGLVHMLV